MQFEKHATIVLSKVIQAATHKFIGTLTATADCAELEDLARLSAKALRRASMSASGILVYCTVSLPFLQLPLLHHLLTASSIRFTVRFCSSDILAYPA